MKLVKSEDTSYAIPIVIDDNSVHNICILEKYLVLRIELYDGATDEFSTERMLLERVSRNSPKNSSGLVHLLKTLNTKT